MIDLASLLSDLQSLLKRLEADLLERSESAEVPNVGQTLQEEFERAREAERTARNYEDWRSDAITQAAAAWVLSCVFVRFLEDNRLIEPPKISGPNNRLQRARDEHELYFREYPRETDREFLLAVFDELAALPGTEDVFSEYSPIRELPNWLSGDMAGELLRFFQKIDADTGDLVHDFTDFEWDTRFLGDLYQDLSEAARKKYALLQTPESVEEFILDRTLDPAIEEFGLEGFKMIDPACGSGHFLLGAFRRIEARWEKHAPDAKCREVVQWTLDSIFGIDVNPFAVAIARFRLLLAALRTCGVLKLANSPAFHVNLACGDSLLHAPLPGGQRVLDFELTADADECQHAYMSEDLPRLKEILRGGQYHAVVANPPYIVPRDQQLNQRYRKRFTSCHRQYSLAVPFMERIFRLAIPAGEDRKEAGYTGQITANSFMKREFGKKLIQEFLPTVDLTHVVDTSGAYIPGHGTPTVILFGRNRKPVTGTIRTVMGIRGEPSTPDDPARGLVWSAIAEQVDHPGSQSEFISVGDSSRDLFRNHPWSIAGGGAAEMKETLDQGSSTQLGKCVASIGFFQDTHADEAFVQPVGFARRYAVHDGFKRQFRGDNVRDWHAESSEEIVFPYSAELDQWRDIPRQSSWSWLHALRTVLWSRSTFGGGTYRSSGRPWFDYHQFPKDRARTPLSIVFAFVATHNHFVLDRGGKVCNRSAPVIKLPPETTEDDHLALLGLLNSSIGCFWMKQVFHNKGGQGINEGLKSEEWEKFYEYDGTKVKPFPLPAGRPLPTSRRLDHLAQQLSNLQPSSLVTERVPTSQLLRDGRDAYFATRGEMILEQEELDWQCYRLYGLLDEDFHAVSADELPDRISLGQRSFEIVLTRKMVRGKGQTTWFERHGSTPITELPADWPDDYRKLVERRIAVIENNPQIALIEQPEYKRRWNTEPWESQVERALRSWLLDRLERYFDFDGRMNDEAKPTAKVDVALTSVAKLADVARQDSAFIEVGEVFRDDPAFDVQRLVDELVRAENVPLLPVLRYKPSGRRKRQEWEKTWELQRAEDAIDDRTRFPDDNPQYLTEDQAHDLKQREIGEIPVPPKYKSSDFISTSGARYWYLRGKLDVPKERWISFPHCEGPDGTLMIAWAGYDHLQLAKSISAYYVDVQQRLGGRDDPRLIPLLACVVGLLPWLKQWHNEIDLEFGMAMGDYFEGFVQEEARQLGKTVDEVKAWQPPKTTRKRTGRKKKVAE